MAAMIQPHKHFPATRCLSCHYAGNVLKLLLIAPACDGQDVGEAWVSYQWVRTLAERYDVTVLAYYKRGHMPLSQQLPGVRVHEWAEPAGIGRMERFNSMLKPGYVPFYFRARRWIRTAMARGERFDLAHQFAPVALRYPSPVAGTPIPFVFGPVGGSLRSPAGFAGEESTSAWYVGLRRLDHARLCHDPWLRRTFREAGCVVGIAPYVRELLADIPLRRFEVISDTGIERMPETAGRSGQSGCPGRSDGSGRSGEVRLLFVGRLVRSKGVRDAIRAVGLIGDPGVSLDVVGTGFDRAACESLTQELALGDRVRFHGWLPRAEVDAFYRAADVFVFPSYREPGGTVVFEAMGHGLPLVVSDLGGPGNAVDDTCGIRVHPVSPDQYARDLAAAIARLAGSPDLRQELGAGARRRVGQVGLWEGKAAKMGEIYAAVLNGQRAAAGSRQT